MKNMSVSQTASINGGKRVTCYLCGAKVWVNPLYGLIRFWWSNDTWAVDVASAHYYGGGYIRKPH